MKSQITAIAIGIFAITTVFAVATIATAEHITVEDRSGVEYPHSTTNEFIEMLSGDK